MQVGGPPSIKFNTEIEAPVNLGRLLSQVGHNLEVDLVPVHRTQISCPTVRLAHRVPRADKFQNASDSKTLLVKRNNRSPSRVDNTGSSPFGSIQRRSRICCWRCRGRDRWCKGSRWQLRDRGQGGGCTTSVPSSLPWRLHFRHNLQLGTALSVQKRMCVLRKFLSFQRLRFAVSTRNGE